MVRSSELVRSGLSEALEPVKDEGRKRRQILDGARKVFLADGFDAASMNEVARRAGVSKGTLYVYFASKEELFAELIREEKRKQAEQLCRFETDDGDLRTTLKRFGVALLDLMLRPASISHLRTVVAVAGRIPSIGQAFYEAGPEFGMKRLARFFDRQVANGRLHIDDTEIAALHFSELCKSRHLLRAILAVCDRPSDAEIDAHVDRAVEVFFRAYGPEHPPRA